MDGVRPSRVDAPSIWYAAVAAPHWKSGGKTSGDVPTSGSVKLLKIYPFNALWGIRTIDSCRPLVNPATWPISMASMSAAFGESALTASLERGRRHPEMSRPETETDVAS